MNVIAYILSGGFLKGYRTYILGAVLALSAVAKYAVGDASFEDLLKELPNILTGLGLMSLRAGVAK